MNRKTINKFLKLRDMYFENGDGAAVVFLKHIWVYFFEYRNELTSSENVIFIPGKFCVTTADSILSELGYCNFSIEHIPAGVVYPCVSTKITFRNTL